VRTSSSPSWPFATFAMWLHFREAAKSKIFVVGCAFSCRDQKRLQYSLVRVITATQQDRTNGGYRQPGAPNMCWLPCQATCCIYILTDCTDAVVVLELQRGGRSNVLSRGIQ
jgi:hypothetical protein